MFTYIRQHPLLRRAIALFLALTHFVFLIKPSAAWALTSGPAQPEFTSFEPVVTTDMVNEFSGDFTYNLPVLNIPGPDGSGYALSLSYHSGATPEEEASWVGSGWTLNPGAINRQMVGIPDDWNGEQMLYRNAAPKNTTVSVSGSLQPEVMSYEVPVSANGTIRYNNYVGFGYSLGAGLSFCKGMVSLGFHLTDGNGSFSLAVNPAAALNKRREELTNEIKAANTELETEAISEEKKVELTNTISMLTKKANKLDRTQNRISRATPNASAYGMHAIDAGTYPMNGHNMFGTSFTLGIGFNVTVLPTEFGVQGNISGTLANQENLPAYTVLRTYGFLYQNSAQDDLDVMDYHTDNATTYNKRDKHLPQSYNDVDLFVATGEGVVGSMRLNADHPSSYRPSETTGSTSMNQIGVELNAGLSLGMSFDAFTVGSQDMHQGSWNNGYADNSPRTDEPYFFRMAGDKGGFVRNGNGTEPENAHVQLDGAGVGYRNGSYAVPMNSYFMDMGGARSGRSSHVGFTTYGELSPERNYERAVASTFTDLPYTGPEILHQIAEISVLNESGKRYNYALPVRATNESSMSYYHSSNSDHNYRWVPSSEVVPGNAQFKTGSSTFGEASYATSYLLTSVVEPDHVDRTGNGPTQDDIGGYTKFYYERKHNIFKWRTPYTGYMYSDPELSECYDNRAQVSQGEKEVKYLERIETKSHVAIFTRAPRADGKGAGNEILDKLTQIDLYLKADLQPTVPGNPPPGPGDAVPIKTVRFAYAYDGNGPTQVTGPGVWPGTPNSGQYDDNGELRKSKLTLKKVWFESNGTNPARIAPYVFHYDYATPSYGNHPAAADLVPTGATVEPSYSVFATDPWGNYRHDGAERYGSLRPWLDQTPETLLFDPAAWQLKRIELPTGGEIHVQYESDDYAYVQNEKAHALVPLMDVEHEPNTDEFHIDVSDLIRTNTTNEPSDFTRDEIMQQLREIYLDPIGPQRKIFYKVMYLFEDPNGVDNCANGRHREFMTGYSTVTHIDPGSNDEINITLESNSRPQKICNQQFKAEKKGKSRDGACGPDALGTGGPNTGGSPLDAMMNFFDNAASYAASGFENNCNMICEENSYFRIPIGERKLGGGLRVKRLLMIDPNAITAGYPAVYGTEYTYKTLDERGRIISSGVASNEPGGLREENVLVRPLDRYKQSFVSRAVAGKDRKQVEGPLGESAYPGASVGYSKVIAKSIHHGSTAPAFTMNEFHTYKDHPIHVSMTDIDPWNDYLPMTTGIINIVRNSIYASQGYTIHVPDMHGKVKRQASYNGDHLALLGRDNVFANLVGSIETDYFDEGEKLPIMTRPDGTVGEYLPLGQETDVCMETREIKERMNNGSIEIDGDVAALPIPFPSVSPMVTVSHTMTKAATHTITKIARYPAVVKRTRTFKDGIYHVTQNVAFDAQTGNPTVVRSHDGFFPLEDIQTAELSTAGQGVYTSVSIPGSMVYKDLGQIAQGERKRIVTNCAGPNSTLCIECTYLNNSNAVLELTNPITNEPSCSVPSALCTGDQLLLTDDAQNRYTYRLASIENNQLFIVRDGSSNAIPTGEIEAMEILHSGCANKLSESAGGFTYYGVQSTADEQDLHDRLEFVNYLNFGLLSSAGGGGLWGVCELNNPVMLRYLQTGTCQPYNPDCDLQNPYTPNPDCIYFNPSENYLIPTLNVYAECEQISPGIWDCPLVDVPQINLTTPTDMCGKFFLPYPGQFALDQDGWLIYQYPNACPAEPLDCPQFCEPIPQITTVTNVVSSNVTTYADDWEYATANYTNGNTTWPGARNDFELGKRGKWRPSSHYAYMTPLTSGTKNYDQGMYDMSLFNYKDPALNIGTPWIKTDLVTRYSPEGHILEELDALGKPSAAKFGYDKMLPTLVAQNSVNSLVLFESFEKRYSPTSPNSLEDGVTFTTLWPVIGWTPTTQHSGKYSYSSSSPVGQLFHSPALGVPAEPTLFHNRKMLIKCWVNASNAGGATEATNLKCTMNETNVPNTQIVDMERIARTGNWVQYSAKIPVGLNATGITFAITCTNPPGTKTAIDDVRIQPVDAQMMTYVYDAKTLRLVTTFDDQHFGQYYQYNGEGKLVRKMIETERGLKTIQENQQNVPLQ